jgi:hypothetical protein
MKRTDGTRFTTHRYRGVVDARFLGRLHLEAALGLSLPWGQEDLRVRYTDTTE